MYFDWADANGLYKQASKRKATDDPRDYIDPDDIDVEGMTIDSSCNQVRGKIRRLLESGTITKTAFANALGVSPKSLNGFLAHSGSMDGVGSDSYSAAWAYFKKREIAGIKMPSKKKKIAQIQGERCTLARPDGITLKGEEDDAVYIYDSCDEIRRKISAHLAKPGVTQAQFCRDLAAQLHTRDVKVQTVQLNRFRGMSGALDGNTSSVYYTAYVYFEKLRLAEDKPKSKHRLEMERRWPNGVDTDRLFNRVWCPNDSRPVLDCYGGVPIQRYR